MDLTLSERRIDGHAIASRRLKVREGRLSCANAGCHLFNLGACHGGTSGARYVKHGNKAVPFIMGDIAIGSSKRFSMETIDRLERFLAAKRVNQLKRAHGLGRLQRSCLRMGRKEENQDGKVDQ